ncbi:TPA: IS1 family transposase [Escherichia coli]|nr:hypothetical protein [Escherichia coli]EFK8341638.1 hypothetical protein [Escherichia coli]EHS3454672.1 hypothetical protein [Escherichia coli]EHS3464091.1 hypothetical protein [Escherichia coli]EHS3478403.1 hypothetical protein [Escherichia coli]
MFFMASVNIHCPCCQSAQVCQRPVW